MSDLPIDGLRRWPARRREWRIEAAPAAVESRLGDEVIHSFSEGLPECGAFTGTLQDGVFVLRRDDPMPLEPTIFQPEIHGGIEPDGDGTRVRAVVCLKTGGQIVLWVWVAALPLLLVLAVVFGLRAEQPGAFACSIAVPVCMLLWLTLQLAYNYWWDQRRMLALLARILKVES